MDIPSDGRQCYFGRKEFEKIPARPPLTLRHPVQSPPAGRGECSRIHRWSRRWAFFHLPQNRLESVPMNPDLLTAREREVLQLAYVLGSCSRRPLAEHLGVSRWTIDQHFMSIGRKLGTPAGEQALSAALELGIIEAAGRARVMVQMRRLRQQDR